MDDFIEKHKDLLISFTQEILKIPNVEGPRLPGAPFGGNIKNALLKALNISKRLGFNVVNLNDILDYAEFGKREDLISVLGHVDVVPPGEGWSYPPFGAEVHDGKIFARGGIDDKGPLMSSLFGLYALKETNINIQKRVRIIFGANEEPDDWWDMKYFKDTVKDPLIGFTPDVSFPLVNREKGYINHFIEKGL